ncbi:MAG TPA: hypothetical protein VMI32_18460 [Candidatus Solibacter sp.]|nr:hypothetical protein [Candidatus Solibacter sp.]
MSRSFWTEEKSRSLVAREALRWAAREAVPSVNFEELGAGFEMYN